MNIFVGQSALTGSFIILASLLLWIIIASKGRIFIKFLLTLFVIWYGLVLFYAPQKMLGFARSALPPNGSIISQVVIMEPEDKKEDAYIYLLIIDPDPDKYTLLEKIHPRKVFSVSEDNIPVLYKIQYTRELHEKLQKTQDETSTASGTISIFELRDNKIQFKVINPIDLMPKDRSK